MAIEQPVASDPLNVPSHSLQHRIIAADASAPVQSIAVDASGVLVGGTPLFSTINPTNLLSNGNFEAWTAGTAVAPDGWALAGVSASVAREGTIIKVGTYSAKVTRAGANAYIHTTFHEAKGADYYKSRTVTFGVWVYATVADRAKLGIGDGLTNSWSSFHTGGSTWEWLTVTKTFAAGATEGRMLCFIDTGDTSGYFDGAMLVEGSSAFAFSPKPAEEGVWADYFATSTINGWAATPTGNIYTKKIGKTVFVAYTITGTSNSAVTNFTVPYAIIGFNQILLNRSIDNGGTAVTGYVAVDTGASLIGFAKNLAGNAWTTSGTKTINGQFFYETE